MEELYKILSHEWQRGIMKFEGIKNYVSVG